MAILLLLNVLVVLLGSSVVENVPFLVRLPLGILGALSAVGIIALWFGMMWNCVVVSQLPRLSKVGWFLLIVFTNMLGALIYYFLVFQKQEDRVCRDHAVVL